MLFSFTNRICTHVTTWMNLKDIMLSERSQTEKVTYCVTPFICDT